MGLIAEANLTAEARKTIEEILAVNTTLADAAVWPDHEGRSIRDFDPLHYVSIPERCRVVTIKDATVRREIVWLKRSNGF